MEKNKTLLIVEQASHDLKQSVTEGSDVIYLEGIFTEFRVKNRNGRIYEAADFIPKMNELMPKIEKRTLLGELDHPVNFDVSLKNVSHVVESLNYDAENDRVIGKIRLLNTEAGKQAQALVRDGIPLHISSRAAGQINPQTGKVTLEKLFTYDLVADPGFENAELKRVNEAYGFGDLNNVFIYECEMPKEENKKENISDNMNNTVNEQQKTVNVSDFQKYTEYIAGVIEGVKHSIDDLKKQMNVNESVKVETTAEKSDDNLKEYVNYLAEQIQKISDHSDYMAEQLQKNCDHNDYLAEQIEKSIDYADYLSENLNNSIEYSKYLSEKLDENFAHNDYLAEQLQKNCDHNDYLAEQVEKTGNYTNYLAEQLQKNCDHNDYLAEQLENTTEYTDYLAENLEKNFAHNDYLAEQINKSFKFGDYLAEQMQNIADRTNMVSEAVEETKPVETETVSEAVEETKPVETETVSESVEEIKPNETETVSESVEEIKPNETETVNESVEEVKPLNSNEAYMSAITEKLDAILKAQIEMVKEDNFLNFLSEGRQNEFNSLDDQTKHMITEAMNAASVKNETQANMVWKSVYESKKGLDLVENMPAVYRDRWNSLSNERKNQILNEAKFYTLKTTNDIEYFWSTRDLRNETLVVERVNTDSAKTWSNDKSKQDDHIASILNRTKKGLRGW